MQMSLIDEYMAHLAISASPATAAARRRFLVMADRELPEGLAAASRTDLAILLGRHGKSAHTRCTYYAHLHGLYQWASSGEDPIFDHDPTASMMKPRQPRGRPKPVTDAELDHAIDFSIQGDWRLIVMLGAFAGLRVNEIRMIHREHISRDLVEVWGGKGNKDRAIPTHEDLWELVRPRPGGLLIQPHPATSTHLSAAARYHFDRIDLRKVTLHRLRHWFGTNLVREGADLRTVQELMGHASLSTTQMYVDVTEGQLRDAVNRLPSRGHGRRKAA